MKRNPVQKNPIQRNPVQGSPFKGIQHKGICWVKKTEGMHLGGLPERDAWVARWLVRATT
jgi:hypothetical protein